jgi:hypothetical protein
MHPINIAIVRKSNTNKSPFVNSGHVDPLFRDVDPSAKQAISVRAL